MSESNNNYKIITLTVLNKIVIIDKQQFYNLWCSCQWYQWLQYHTIKY